MFNGSKSIALYVFETTVCFKYEWLLSLWFQGSLHSFLSKQTTSWMFSLNLCQSLSQGLSYLHSDLLSHGTGQNNIATNACVHGLSVWCGKHRMHVFKLLSSRIKMSCFYPNNGSTAVIHLMWPQILNNDKLFMWGCLGMWELQEQNIVYWIFHTDLHKPPVAHRDLSSSNVLVKADGTCALCDFGCSTILRSCSEPYRRHNQNKNTKVRHRYYCLSTQILLFK